MPDVSPPARPHRRVWPWVVGTIAVALLAGAAVAGTMFVSQVFAVKDDLEQAKPMIPQLAAQATAGDVAGAQATAADLDAVVSSARATVDEPLWRMLAAVPFVGQNVDAVRRTTVAVDILVQDALPPGIGLLSQVNVENLRVEGGGINLAPLRDAQASLGDVATAFSDAQAEVGPIDQAALLPFVAEPIAEVVDVVNQAAPTLDIVGRYLPTLLSAAGDGGTKTYLVIFQNNAEIRATGGNPAASMVITVTDGRVQMLDQASSATFYETGAAGVAHTDLPPETLALYPGTFSRYSQDYTMTPDFPTTARLFGDAWQASTGDRFDGVISVDPVVLAHMLAVAGPVTLPDGQQITADSAVKTLLSDAYERFPDGTGSDAYFAEVARATFQHLVAGDWDPAQMLAALETSAQEQRLYLAFADPAAQELAVELGLDGALSAQNEQSTQVGLYFNDYSVGKLEYHLSSSIAATCDAAARTMTVTATLHNSIPDTITSGYTLGLRNGTYGYPKTSMMLDVLMFAPPGAQIVAITPSDGDVPSLQRVGAEAGHTAQSRLIAVGQNETRTIEYTIRMPEGALGPLDLRHTPTARDTPVTVDASCDALFRN